MILAVDVQYRNDYATAAGVLFPSWESDTPSDELVAESEQVAAYRPGQFYLRELPCILALLPRIHNQPACFIIDGYISLGKEGKPGLGMHLWNALAGKIPVIGVAKSRYMDTAEECELYRGRSKRPLYVTAVGISLDEAKEHIRGMHGVHRIPTMLKRVDQLCRGLI